jgi:hypothetical protein
MPVLPPHHHYSTPLPYTTRHSITLLLSYQHLLPSITDTDSCKGTLVESLHDSRISNLTFLDYLKNLLLTIASQEDALAAKQMRSQTFLLKIIGVDRLVFRLNSEALHRIYNRGSFSCNGRAYGALHQNLAQSLRSLIRINDRPTVELDFSAYHIQMLYHREGIDYTEDPYVKPGGPEMRDIFKAVGLEAINAGSPESAYGAIREELDDRGILLPEMERPLVSLVDGKQPFYFRLCRSVSAASINGTAQSQAVSAYSLGTWP